MDYIVFHVFFLNLPISFKLILCLRFSQDEKRVLLASDLWSINYYKIK